MARSPTFQEKKKLHTSNLQPVGSNKRVQDEKNLFKVTTSK